MENTANRSLLLRQMTTRLQGPGTVPALPKLGAILGGFMPMPKTVLFLGVASDGMPVLLNLNDPIPGPILIAGDPGARKTAFLRMIAQAVGMMHSSEEVQLGVLTNHVEEWSGLEAISNCAGLFPLDNKSAEKFLLSLASWAHGNKVSKQFVILLVDGLDVAANLDPDARQNLLWLLARGPSRRVWPVVTLNAQRQGEVIPWLDHFRTRLVGRIQDQKIAQGLGVESADARSLGVGHFSIREGEQWLRFWTPDVDD